MVFADRNELVSGGNFHGEYPAKVRVQMTVSIHIVSLHKGFCNLSTVMTHFYNALCR